MTIWVVILHQWVGSMGYAIIPTTTMFTTQAACIQELTKPIYHEFPGPQLPHADYVCEAKQIRQ